MDNLKGKTFYRNAAQLFFLLVFVFLVVQGRAQLWIVIFGIGLLISLIWGRFYCGWFCPINTILRIKKWVYNKLHIEEKKTPVFIKKTWLRWSILALFVLTMVISSRNNIQLNMLLYVLIAAFVISLLLDEETWHKYLCPYGSILSITDKANNKHLIIDEEKCRQCGLCAENCPNNIITITRQEQYISRNECLYCFKCQDVCVFNAVSYQNIKYKSYS